MRLDKDKTALTVNPSLTLAGIPPETFEYRLGNRSALEWSWSPASQTTQRHQSDPNREDDPQYIVRLVGQVVRVKLGNRAIVRRCRPSSQADFVGGADRSVRATTRGLLGSG